MPQSDYSDIFNNFLNACSEGYTVQYGYNPWQQMADFVLSQPQKKKSVKLKDYIQSVLHRHWKDANIKVLDWAYSKKFIWERFVELHDGTISQLSDARQCQKSGKWYNYYSGFFYVVTNFTPRIQQLWHDSERDNAIYSHCGKWFDKNLPHEMIDVGGSNYCRELGNFIQWADGSYHRYAQEVSGDGVPCYHNSLRPWGETQNNKLVFGCELEILAKNDRKKIFDIAIECGLTGEEDGSLNRSRGIEIIGGPEELKDYQNPAGKWLQFFKKIRGLASAGGRNYGLHVSVNRAALSKLHSGKVFHFIHQNKTLCELVAKRKEHRTYSVFRGHSRVSHGRFETTDRYAAVAMRSKNRLEYRFFKSTATAPHFLRAVEFTAAVVEFTRHESARNLTEGKFLEWLKKNNKSYKNLAVYLKVINKPKKFKRTAKKKVKIAA